jgi:hypothetical protein
VTRANNVEGGSSRGARADTNCQQAGTIQEP